MRGNLYGAFKYYRDAVVRNIVYRSAPILTHISPMLNTKVLYRYNFKRKLDLSNPITLNEKILWLKFNTYLNNPLVKQCADKYRVRNYVKQMCVSCNDILPRLLGTYQVPEEIDWDSLPNQFALKCNIGCGYNHIVTNKSKENREHIVAEVHRWLELAPQYWIRHSEIQYRNVEPVILIEEYLGGPNGDLPDDYKFYCINGKCYMTMFCKDRDNHGHGARYFFMDRNWNMITNGYGEKDIPVEKPICFEKAIALAEKLSEPFPFVRVDFYLLGERIVFGELTFTPAAGMDIDHKLKPLDSDEDLDHIYGKILELPKQ